MVARESGFLDTVLVEYFEGKLEAKEPKRVDGFGTRLLIFPRIRGSSTLPTVEYLMGRRFIIIVLKNQLHDGSAMPLQLEMRMS